MEKQGASQFHPTRDIYNRPPEYELPYGGSKGINVIPGGYYESEAELDHAKQFWTDEGADNDPEMRQEARAHFEPMQGRFFDPEKHEAANRQKLGRERFQAGTSAEALRNSSLQDSRIPTSHLQSRPGRQETEFSTNNNAAYSGALGWYRGPSGSENPDKIAVDPNGPHLSDTVVHEMGHRRHLGTMAPDSPLISHPRNLNPDPLKEGVADAYTDRYGGPSSPQARALGDDIDYDYGAKFSSYQFTGYSSDKERADQFGWNDDDRAVYAATRAHGSETGEQPLYQPAKASPFEYGPRAKGGKSGDPTIDATLHSLSQSPHGAHALISTGLDEVAEAASRRHMDRRLMNEGQTVQHGMFTELSNLQGQVRGYTPDLDVIDTNDEGFEAHADRFSQDIQNLEAKHGESIWPNHMSRNQFGEQPRTMHDVGETLGVTRDNAFRRGFTPR